MTDQPPSTDLPDHSPDLSQDVGEDFGETIKTAAIAIFVALLLRSLLFEPFNIPSSSMMPNLLVGDYLFVSKMSYGYSYASFPFGIVPLEDRIFGELPERGDVAVFKKPTPPHVDYIKRIIGLPGDQIQVKSGILHINGQAVERRLIGPYEVTTPSGIPVQCTQYRETLPSVGGVDGHTHDILECMNNAPHDNTPVYTVPAGHVFAMGDNRDNSQDSRYQETVGFIPIENLVGEAKTIFFSIESGYRLWQVWTWPWAARWQRFFSGIK